MTAWRSKAVEKGKVLFRRAGGTGAALTMHYMVKGSAKASVGYKPLPGTVMIPAGVAQVKVKINCLSE